VTARARPVGINHVALEVADIDQALDFYGRLFELEVRELGQHYALVCFGDQVLALFATKSEPALDVRRHVGLVVDDKESVRRALGQDGAGGSLHFRDPWGNHIQVVDYAECRFRKHPDVAAALGIDDLEKSERALGELREAGLLAGNGAVRGAIRSTR
jgi:lactoylglutathione lyase